FKTTPVGRSAMRWAARNRFKLDLIRLVVCVLTIVFTASAQDLSDVSSEYTITTFEGQVGASFGTAEGAPLFIQKNEFIRMNPGGELTPVPIDEIEIHNWTYGDGSLWMLGKSKNIWGIHRIDFQTGRLLDTIPLEHDRHEVISYGYGSLWVFTAFELAKPKPLLRIDPQTKQVTTIDLGQGFKGTLAINEQKVWLLGVEDGDVKCLDPQSNKVVDEFSGGREHDNGILKGAFKGGSYGYGIGDGMLWVLDTRDMHGGKRVLSGYDLKTHERKTKLETDDTVWPPVVWNGYV